MAFVLTNVVGTVNLLNAAKILGRQLRWQKIFTMFQQMEVYGELHNPEDLLKLQLMTRLYIFCFKSSSDREGAYGNTYKMPVVITNCSNNYGPNHFPEVDSFDDS